MPAPTLRRFVTRLDPDGLTRIGRADELQPPPPGAAAALPPEVMARSYPDGAPRTAVVWDCEQLPPRLPADPDWRPSGLRPKRQGARISVTTYPPGWSGQMFWSSRVDILWIVSGALTYVTDGGDEIEIGPGDFVIQNGANKQFINRGTEPTILGAVMLSAAQTGPLPPMDRFHGEPDDLYFEA